MNITPYQPPENKDFIGRVSEKRRLLEICALNQASIVVVHGRRRVGKTEFIEQTLRQRNLLKFEGIQNKPKEYQIRSILAQVARYTTEQSFQQME